MSKSNRRRGGDTRTQGDAVTVDAIDEALARVVFVEVREHSPQWEVRLDAEDGPLAALVTERWFAGAVVKVYDRAGAELAETTHAEGDDDAVQATVAAHVVAVWSCDVTSPAART